MKLSAKRLALIVTAMMWALPISAQRPACSPQKTFTVEPIELPDLRYRLIDKFGSLRFCDPECPSSCHLVLEQQHAEEAFPQIRRQEDVFRDIVQHLRLGTIRDFSDTQKLAVYREYKKLLCGMSLEAQGETHKFEFAAADGFKFEGTITPNGAITIANREPVPLICPK